MRRNSLIPTRTALAIIVVFWCVSPDRTARAQPATQPDAEAAEDAPQTAPGPFSLRLTEAALELDAEFEQRRVRVDGGPFAFTTRQRNRTRRFEELLRLGVDGGTADPDLFSFSGTIGLGLSQERFSESFNGVHDEDHADGGLTEFDLRADLFQSNKLSGTVFGLRTNDRYSRAFLPSLRERRTEYGTQWNWNDPIFPMELRVEHRDTDRDGGPREFDSEHLTENLVAYALTWNHRPNHTLRLDAEYDDREDRYSGSRFKFKTQRTQLRLQDSFQFGPENEHHLDTTLRYQEEDGDLQRDLLEIGPRLTLNHSRDLSSYYQYQFSREQVGQLNVDLHRADVGLVHQLFTNLTTTANLFGLHEDVEHDIETDEVGGSVDWAYVRNNPLGVFSADLGLTHELERSRGGGTRVQLRESATFRDPLPVTLARPNVWMPSIIVWNSTRTRRFLPGIDYQVYRLRDRVQLTRLLLGRIANNDSVSVDYVWFEDPDTQRSTSRVDFRVQQQFKSGWTPYYAMEFRHEDRDRSLAFFPLTENDLNRHRIGVKYQKPRYAFGLEFEALKDNIDPFIAYHIFGERNFLSRPTASVDGRLDFSQFFFDRGGERDVILVEATLDARHEWRRDSTLFAMARYRYEEDQSREGVTHGVDIEGGAEYRWGQYTIIASIEYDLLDIVKSHEDGFGVWVKVRRDFLEGRSQQ